MKFYMRQSHPQFRESSLIATFRGLEEMMAYGYERFLLKLADQVEADNRR